MMDALTTTFWSYYTSQRQKPNLGRRKIKHRSRYHQGQGRRGGDRCKMGHCRSRFGSIGNTVESSWNYHGGKKKKM